MAKAPQGCRGAKNCGKGKTELRKLFAGSPEDSCLDMKTPAVPLEDLPYTLSLVATVSSQHGIERIQSNCPLGPVEYLGDNKTAAQVIHKSTNYCQHPSSLGPDLVPHSIFPKCSFLCPINQRELHCVPFLSLFNLQSLLCSLAPAADCAQCGRSL